MFDFSQKLLGHRLEDNDHMALQARRFRLNQDLSISMRANSQQSCIYFN